MVLDSLAYHPAVDHYLRFVATTVGRDKLLRTIQYFARFYAWYLLRTNAPTARLAPWNAVKRQFGLVRRALRLGKNVEHAKAAAVAADAKEMDPVLKYCAVGRQLGYAAYLTLDMGTYLDAAGIKPSPWAARLQREAWRAWLAGLTFSAVAGLYRLWHLREAERRLDRSDGESVVEGKKIRREREAANLQLVSDACDMTMPTASLGLVNLDDGIVGMACTVSSLIGVWAQWKKTA